MYYIAIQFHILNSHISLHFLVQMFTFSPIGSRPPSPKSDTEYETQKYDVQSQTLLTGDDLKEDDVQWRWGELPEKTPETAHHHPVSEASQATGASNGKPGCIFFRPIITSVWPFWDQDIGRVNRSIWIRGGMPFIISLNYTRQSKIALCTHR